MREGGGENIENENENILLFEILIYDCQRQCVTVAGLDLLLLLEVEVEVLQK